jgi:hypothetical protein
MLRSLFIILSIFISIETYSQGKKKKKEKELTKQQTILPNSLNPSYQEKVYAPKASKVKSKGISYEGEKKYYERKALVEKERRKVEKELMKPQYSDFTYFGHKRPPKRHKVGKLKYCKECGLRH